MKNTYVAKTSRFHNFRDVDRYYRPGKVVETKETKYVITQERSLAYRFSLHQHPYVRPLIERLIRKGSKGLQAADTEYEVGQITLPFGVDVELDAAIVSTVTANSRISLLAKVTATDAANVPLELTKGSEFTLAANTAANVMAGTRATLAERLTAAPYPRVTFALSGAKKAIAIGDVPVTFPNQTQILLADGSTARLPAATAVMLAATSEFEIPANTQVRVLRRRMRPVKDLYAEFFSAYGPNTALVRLPYPVLDLDFTSSGAYSIYNWELFFHVPLTIAMHLSKNQRFGDAQQWFHYLFDPTDDGDGPTPERFWKVRPFQTTDVHKIEEILVNLATGADPALRNETIRSIEAWKDAPFRPHVIARYRQQAYMYKTVMAYLDNLIAWGDSLFQQDTGEAIDEALQIYVLAANILGPRPLPVPKKGNVRAQTYANLRNDLDQFGTVLRDMEPDLPFDLMPLPDAGSADADRLATLRSLGKALYFCVPRNDKLLGYWDTVADRLFKIRNSLNIQGIFRQLALFEPPIDPALLARAAAAGLDVGAIVNGVNQPLPLVRFTFLVQRASEIVQEVKSLGNALLSAMEKEDGEAMAVLRARHERIVMEMVEHVRYGQLQEAIKAKEGVVQSLAVAAQRYTFYQQQLGKAADEIARSIPALNDLELDSLTRMKFSVKEPELGAQPIEFDIAQDLGASGGRIVSSHEREEFLRLQTAQALQEEGANLNLIAKFLSLIPEFEAEALPMGVGAAIQFGGRALSGMLSMSADAAAISAGRSSYEASKASRIGSYARREQEWMFQSNLAAAEITQTLKALRGAQIREAIAELELRNHRTQMKHAEEIERFLNDEGTEKTGKKTNRSLYAWMKREVRGLYSQSFQFAFDIARKAERALQHELGRSDATYLQFGYLSGKEGLLAGEKLHLDLKRMELAFHEQNQREYELTKHVSLLQVDPLALVQLRQTGRCTVRLPESLFDLDGPGHYFRRIKAVAVSVPCVTGPYVGVNSTLTLLKSSIRTTPVVGDQYARVDAEDTRFSDHFASLQSIVTSTGQNDSGMFDVNLRDERYLPFENSGVISEWQLQLPADPSRNEPAQFDYGTISDVILHLRYTAREGGRLLRNAAMATIKDQIASAQAAGSLRLLSLRHEFPSEWAKFLNQQPAAGQRFELALTLRPEHYPFWSRNPDQIAEVQVLAKSSAAAVPGSIDIYNRVNDAGPGVTMKDTLTKDPSLGNLLAGRFTGGATGIPLPGSPVGEVKLYFDQKTLADLWIAVAWTKA